MFRSSQVAAALLILLASALPLAAQDTPAPQSPADATDGPLPDMAAIEQAWARGDFVFVREGLKRLAEEGGTALAQYRYGRVLIEGRGGPRRPVQAVAWLEKAVAQNHIEAATLLAQILLAEGLSGVTRDPVRAADLLGQAAARGHAPAQYALGGLWAAGDGVEADPKAAFNWYLAAAEQGHREAQFALARSYLEGTGTDANIDEGLRWLEEAATSGHVQAQYFLARAHETGNGTPANPAEAQRWYRRAAEAGLPIAQRSLGMLYLTGAGVDTNAEEALRWLEAAASAGDPGAMFNLGQAHASGTVLAQDDARAYVWFARAADSDLPRAITAQARFAELGRGIDADTDAAIALYRRAAEAGDIAAMQRLGQLAAAGTLDGKLAPQRAVPWAAVAAQAGDAAALDWLSARANDAMPEAQAMLGQLLLDDPDQQTAAINWLTRAATSGHVPSQGILGQAYATGDHGLAQDYIAAHTWLNLAAGAGDDTAAETREVIAALMTPEQIAEAQSAARGLYDGIQARTPKTVQTVVNP